VNYAAELLGKLGGVSLIPLAVALALHLAKLGARGRAWHNIVRAAYPTDRLCFRDALAAFLAGVGVDAVVPARAGELVRLGLVRRHLATSAFPGLVSTVLAESVFDAILTALVIALAIAVGFGAHLPGAAFVLAPVAQHLLTATLAGSALALTAAWLGVRLRARIRSFLLEARRGLVVFARPRDYARRVASWQALGWGLRVSSVYWYLLAFHLPATLATAVLVVAVQLAAGAVPLTPGGVGPQQALLTVALSTSAAATVLGFSIGMQAVGVLSDLVLGAASLLFLTGSVRWRRVALRREAAPMARPGESVPSLSD
jgi:uncharacterized membrane protein YbhN (UPF0104 family)